MSSISTLLTFGALSSLSAGGGPDEDGRASPRADETELSSTITAAEFDALATGQAPQESEDPPARGLHDDLDRLLRQHVRDERVDYLLLRRDGWEFLLGYLDRMSRVDPAELDRSVRLAYWINLYNASMIRLVGERLSDDYSPADDEHAVFEEESLRTLGGPISLNHLENGILRPRFEEPRIHVALVCGARSCPPLIAEAYTAAKLEDQLQRNMERFVRDPARNRVNAEAGTVRLSKVFEWHADDFGGPEDLAAYVDRFHAADLAQATVAGFLDYSWELNIAPPAEGRWVSAKGTPELRTRPHGGPVRAARRGELFEVRGELDGWLRLARWDGEPDVWLETSEAAAWPR